jgi:hypothetical protein
VIRPFCLFCLYELEESQENSAESQNVLDREVEEKEVVFFLYSKVLDFHASNVGFVNP